MKIVKAFALAMVLSCLPLSALADSIFDNTGGVISKTSVGGLTLTSSLLTSINGAPATGSVTLTTGTLSGGSLSSSATFLDGTFKITGTGLLFTGTLTNATWTAAPGLPAGEFEWTLSGTVNGTLNGSSVTGGTVQFTTLVIPKGGTNPFGTGGPMKIKLSNGITSVPTATPELGTLSLLGTGLVGIALIARRKTAARNTNR